MPIQINRQGKPYDARLNAIKIYDNFYDNIVIHSDLKEIDIHKKEIFNLIKFEWLHRPKRKGAKVTEYQLTPAAIKTIEHYILSDKKKKCIKCGKEKKISEFSIKRSNADGVNNVCMECTHKKNEWWNI